MAQVDLVGVSKVYDGRVSAVTNATLAVRDREFLVLVGPSGCGKSTILRMIAGLEDPTSGEIRIDGALMNRVPSKDRDIAMIFQDFALYPHMSVYDNMAFPLKMRKIPKEEVRRRVTETADLIGVESLLGRKPHRISGGERQRVALGRALVRDPKVFLMDEPLSNLDAKLRVQMRMEIQRLHRHLEATVIYVTHDQTEAMTMGTRIAVLRDGHIQQVDTPRRIYEQPANTFVASFIGAPPMNLLEGTIAANGRSAHFQSGDTSFPFPAARAKELLAHGYEGKAILLGIRPEHVRIRSHLETGSAETAALSGCVELVEDTGAEICTSVELACGSVLVRSHPDQTTARGTRVHLYFDPDRLHFFDAATGVRVNGSGAG